MSEGVGRRQPGPQPRLVADVKPLAIRQPTVGRDDVANRYVGLVGRPGDWEPATRLVVAAEHVGQRIAELLSREPRGDDGGHLVAPGQDHRGPGVDDDDGPGVGGCHRADEVILPAGKRERGPVEPLGLDLVGRSDHDHRDLGVRGRANGFLDESSRVVTRRGCPDPQGEGIGHVAGHGAEPHDDVHGRAGARDVHGGERRVQDHGGGVVTRREAELLRRDQSAVGLDLDVGKTSDSELDASVVQDVRAVAEAELDLGRPGAQRGTVEPHEPGRLPGLAAQLVACRVQIAHEQARSSIRGTERSLLERDEATLHHGTERPGHVGVRPAPGDAVEGGAHGRRDHGGATAALRPRDPRRLADDRDAGRVLEWQ